MATKTKQATKRAAARKRTRRTQSSGIRVTGDSTVEIISHGGGGSAGRTIVATAAAGSRYRGKAADTIADLQRRLERSLAHSSSEATKHAELQDDATQRHSDLSYQRTVDERARPCPFCGQEPSIRPWHGGPLTKRIIGCDNSEGCEVQPSITGDDTETALARWNQRARSAAQDDAIMEAWGLLCNVNGGNLDTQSQEWRDAFKRFGDTQVSPAASAISTR